MWQSFYWGTRSVEVARPSRAANWLTGTLELIAKVSVAIIASVVTASGADGVSKPREWTLYSVLGLIAPLLAAIYASFDRFTRRRHYEDAKIALELVKLKLEIEGIRKSQQLSLPEITVTPEDFDVLHHPVGTHFRFFDPGALRKSWWFRLVQRYPRWGRAFATLGSVTAAFYGTIGLFGPVALVTDSAFRQDRSLVGVQIALGVFEIIVGALLLMLSIRIHRAKKLALDEARPSA
jgi:hypothetical protein